DHERKRQWWSAFRLVDRPSLIFWRWSARLRTFRSAQCPLHRERGDVHLALDIRRDLVGQYVDGPDDPAEGAAVAGDLHRGVVVSHAFVEDGIRQPPSHLVAIDQQLARHIAIMEGHDPRVAVEP